MGAFSAPMAASVRAFSSGRAGLPSGFGTSQVSALQRSAGNQAVARLVAPPMFIARMPPPAPGARRVAEPGAPRPAGAGPAPPGPSSTPAGPAVAGAEPAGRREPGERDQLGRVLVRQRAERHPDVPRGRAPVPGLGPARRRRGGPDERQAGLRRRSRARTRPEIKAFMAGRHAVAILNNGIGHVIYVVELVQDIATASVVGAEVDAITIPLNEILLGIKVGVDGVQFLADFGLTCAAQYRSMKAPPGPAGAASRAAWDGMVANYEANLVGDLVGGIFDIIDLSSAGFSNSQPVKQGAKAVKATFDTAKLVKGLIKSVLQGWFGVWGGKAFERGAPGGGVHGIAERAAGGVDPRRAAADEGLLHGRRHDHRRGRGPHRQAADRAQPGRDDRARRQGPVHHGARRGRRGPRPRSSSGSAISRRCRRWPRRPPRRPRRSRPGPPRRAARSTACRSRTSRSRRPTSATTRCPTSPRARSTWPARSPARACSCSSISSTPGVDELKSMLTPPVDTIKEHATDLGEFMQVVTNEAKEQITSTRRGWPTSRRSSRSATRFEDVVNMVIQQIFDMVGLESDFEIDDIRQLWVEVGGMIDEGIVWATALASGQPTEPPAGAAAAGGRRRGRRRGAGLERSGAAGGARRGRRGRWRGQRGRGRRRWRGRCRRPDRGPCERAGRRGRGGGQLAAVGGPERRGRGPRSPAARRGGRRGRRRGGRRARDRPGRLRRRRARPVPPERRAPLRPAVSVPRPPEPRALPRPAAVSVPRPLKPRLPRPAAASAPLRLEPPGLPVRPRAASAKQPPGLPGGRVGRRRRGRGRGRSSRRRDGRPRGRGP